MKALNSEITISITFADTSLLSAKNPTFSPEVSGKTSNIIVKLKRGTLSRQQKEQKQSNSSIKKREDLTVMWE